MKKVHKVITLTKAIEEVMDAVNNGKEKLCFSEIPRQLAVDLPDRCELERLGGNKIKLVSINPINQSYVSATYKIIKVY